MKYIMILFMFMTGCFEKPTESANDVLLLFSCRLGYVLAVQDTGTSRHFVDKDDLLQQAEESCKAELSKLK